MEIPDGRFVSEFILSEDGRLDACLRKMPFPGADFLSRSSWEKLFGLKRIKGKRGNVLAAGDRLAVGETVFVEFPSPELGLLPDASLRVEPVAGAINKGWLAFNKPAGMPSHPNSPWEKGCLANHVSAYLDGQGISAAEFARLGPPPRLEGGLVHRLDNDTSGALVVATNPTAKEKLRDVFSIHQVEKIYWALVLGQFSNPGLHTFSFVGTEKKTFVMDAPEDSAVAPSSSRGLGQVLDGTYDVTVLHEGAGATWLEIRTVAGVRHQIRAACAALGHPLIGDALYQTERQREQDSSGELTHRLHARSILLPGEDRIIVDSPAGFKELARRFAL